MEQRDPQRPRYVPPSPARRMITSDLGGGGPAALPHEPPFRRELTFVGVGQATWLVPEMGRHSCGTAPEWNRTSLRLRRPGICARHREDTAARSEPLMPRDVKWAQNGRY